MAVKNYTCGSSPTIKIEADDHLSLVGWDNNEIQIKIQDESSLYLRQSDDHFTIHCETDCVINVPAAASINIISVDGSASLSSLKGNLTVENVGGHLTLRDTGKVVVENIGGHLKAYQVNGDLQVMNIGGSVKGGSINGMLRVENVGGSVKIMDVLAIQSLRAGGNIKIKLLTVPEDVKISAGANIKIWLPKGLGYELSALSGAERIVVRSADSTVKYNTGRHQQKVGEGGPTVTLHAGAAISILENGFDEDSGPEDILGELDIEGIVGSVVNDRMQERIQDRIRRAEERARVTSQRAEDRLRRAMERMERNQEVPMPKWNFPGSDKAPASKPAPKASSEERMLVLNLLRDKRITAEEANKLLDALEGKFDS